MRCDGDARWPIHDNRRTFRRSDLWASCARPPDWSIERGGRARDSGTGDRARRKGSAVTELPPFDPRSIANLMLDEASDAGVQLTHIAVQKLLYFAHALFLIEKKRPLVTGHFEAWQYGPVHPAVFQAFRGSGRKPLTKRAENRDPITGVTEVVPATTSALARNVVRKIISQYGSMNPGRLVEISHAKGAPWDIVVNKAKTSVALGMRISDNLIIDRFRFHKVSVDEDPRVGEMYDEDAPIARHGFG